LLTASSGLPGNIRRTTFKRSPIWPCSMWGLPCPAHYWAGGELLPRHFTLTATGNR